MKRVLAYKCSNCGQLVESVEELAKHGEECEPEEFRDVDPAEQEFLLELAKLDGSLCVLVRGGLLDAALSRARNIVSAVADPEYSDLWCEAITAKMVFSVRRALDAEEK